ncbi:MAG: class I SAM-dependent methyltransferase [Cyanobacteria bacterium P01_A01_bin.84]
MSPIKLPYQLIHTWLEDGESVRENYVELVSKEGLASAKSLGERKEHRDWRFFDCLFDTISISSKDSILDIGCGKGELIDYFSLHSPDFNDYDYLGIDIVPDFIKLVRQNFPERKFELINFIDPSFFPEKQFDIVVALGVLVTRVQQYDLFVEYFVKKMINCAKKYVLFNIISDIDPSSGNYSDPNAVGHSTVLNVEVLHSFIDTIPHHNYRVTPHNIFPDATDLFVQIQLEA